MFPTLPLVPFSVNNDAAALSYQINFGQTMNVPYSTLLSQELKGSILTPEVRGNVSTDISGTRISFDIH